ncbi:hypothetical protein WS83_16275 [Burkholderia sp. MSMB2042]|nr:hypothetical protein WS78_07125 [Burkholderia savannae]KVG46714.1 hypothetical protein WS77_30505 [Burkholderia sp. MSMB0265]KVG87389.1 hypothetical protein WS81_27580 [Burkholderia sp. MSMB2040]KVG92315.1 hypothetical protein WS82_11955 [Burkholderia sp. MSMB2041]KVH02452.1 hypothetical protein WS83_16275 [Burkholderia sp. MSMB2042]
MVAAALGIHDVHCLPVRGRLGEGSIRNLALRNGETAAWPNADMPSGVTMQIPRCQLTRRGATATCHETSRPPSGARSW